MQNTNNHNEKKKDLAAADSVSYTYQCPSCNKLRLIRPVGHVVSNEIIETTTPTGLTIKVHKEMCDPCINKVIRKYYMPNKEDVRKVMNLQDLEGKSLDEIL